MAGYTVKCKNKEKTTTKTATPHLTESTLQVPW